MASELFPLLSEGRTFTGSLGLTLGFAGGLATVFGVEHLANAMEARHARGAAECQRMRRYAANALTR